ncbi:tumor necrosis factor receptor superfamily member 14-like [Tupaia chinensis]|uniref:tumor necrosis factor receptor superfamily member 14-like n=1 Tax=Tupaia chinensis TaxID=246437 RepID=UPI000FFC4BA7|nr:tumor necrosis factor receptor superfamily member 14-like [Tupaia chinensis]
MGGPRWAGAGPRNSDTLGCGLSPKPQACWYCPASAWFLLGRGISTAHGSPAASQLLLWGPSQGPGHQEELLQHREHLCGCSQGHFCDVQDGDHCIVCQPHTICRPGQRMLERGTESQDTVCQDCPPGTFSLNGTQEECQPWTRGVPGKGSSTLSWEMWTHPSRDPKLHPRWYLVAPTSTQESPSPGVKPVPRGQAAVAPDQSLSSSSFLEVRVDWRSLTW